MDFDIVSNQHPDFIAATNVTILPLFSSPLAPQGKVTKRHWTLTFV